MRSSWKAPIFVYNLKNLRKSMFYKKAQFIIPKLVGKRIGIYNGKKFFSIVIRKPMVGLRMGEVIVTKVLGRQIHTKKQKRKNSSK